MAFIASDGRRFATSIQQRKYEDWLQEEGKAPGGPSHQHDLKMHGNVREVKIIRETSGRHKVMATHADGYIHRSVHPDAQRANGIAAELLGINPPPSQAVHQRTRAHPVGPKEEERVAIEDSREVETIEP